MKELTAALAMSWVLAMPAWANDCDPGYEGGAEDFDLILDEIEAMPAPMPTGLNIAGQSVYASGDPGSLDRLRAIAPRIAEQIDELGAVADRAVYLVESATDTFDGTLAFTLCPDTGDEAPVVDGLDLPVGTCLLVVYPDRPGSDEYMDFVLAHEWMHTLQTGTYGLPPERLLWWREGTADWFAHRVVPGFAGRDEVIGQFFDQQQSCPLTDIAYPSQVFFFWGAETYYDRWPFEIGIGDEAYLSGPARVASILPPEDWLAWAEAQAGHTITLPDGRALPAQAPVEEIVPGDACSIRIEGPPLSAQLRAVTFPEGFSHTVRVQSGGAQLAMRGADGSWEVLADGTLFHPSGRVELAAIQPSAARLDVTLVISDGTAPACACYVGSWMEQPLEDGFRFRLKDPRSSPIIAAGTGIETEWRQEGPLLTIEAGGRYRFDDPSVAVMIDPTTGAPAVAETGVVWKMDLEEAGSYGSWTEDRGRLGLMQEGTVERGTFTVLGNAQPWDDSRTRRHWAPDVWTPACHGEDELRFYGPMEPEMQAAGAAPNLVALFRRAGL